MRGASTLPWRKHLLKTKLLSTHSNMALPSSPDISGQRAAINHPLCIHRLNEKLLSTHSNIAWPSNPHISRRRADTIHPWVLWLSVIFAPCLGPTSSKAVLMSMLAKYIVGWTTLPCLNMGVFSSCHSQGFCCRSVIRTCRCWHLFPSTPPVRKFFQFSGSFFFQTKKNTGRVPLRHHRCKRKPCSFGSLSLVQHPLFLPFPVLLLQNCHHNLQVLAPFHPGQHKYSCKY